MTLVKINNCEAFIVSLNHEKVTKDQENIKIIPFTNKYNWEKINLVSQKDVLYEKIYPAYVSKHNLNRQKQVILLMISNREKLYAKSEGLQWHYLAVKDISALLRRIKSKTNGDFYCLNCLHSKQNTKQKNKLELHKTVLENKDFVM